MDPEQIEFKISLIILLLIANNINPSLSYATNQKTESISEKKPYKQLNDPTMPKITAIEDPADLKTGKPTEEQQAAASQIINPSKLKLSMIIIKNDDKSAVINDQTVRERDKISGYEITKIERNKVILKNPITKTEHAKPKNQKKNNELEKLKLAEPETFTELKLPSVTIKSFLASPKNHQKKISDRGDR